MDISKLLEEWEYDPENTVRLINAAGGRQVMQVRLPLGIEQYELDDRPDGTRPFGCDSVLSEMQRRLSEHIEEYHSDSGFELDTDDFELLQSEGLLFYYRYLLLFGIGDYERTLRDTRHNLELCEFVEHYVAEDVDADSLLQYRPYIVRVHALSEAMIVLNQGDQDEAVQIVEEAIYEIEELPEIDTMIFQFERMRSLNHLRETLEQFGSVESAEVERLEAELAQAVESENYERAAEIRDEISVLRDPKASE